MNNSTALNSAIRKIPCYIGLSLPKATLEVGTVEAKKKKIQQVKVQE